MSGNDDAIFFGNTDAGNSGNGVLYTSAIKRGSYSFPDGQSFESLDIVARGAKIDPQYPDLLIKNNPGRLHLIADQTILSVGALSYVISGNSGNSDISDRGLTLKYIGSTKLSDSALVIGFDCELFKKANDGTRDYYLRESNVNRQLYRHLIEITITDTNGLTFGGYLFSINNTPTYSNFKNFKESGASNSCFFFGNLNGVNLSGKFLAVPGSSGNNYFSYYDGTEKKSKYFSEDSVRTFNDLIDSIYIH